MSSKKANEDKDSILKINQEIKAKIMKVIRDRFASNNATIKNLSQLSLKLGKSRNSLATTLGKKTTLMNTRLLFQIASVLECTTSDILPGMSFYLNFMSSDRPYNLAQKNDYKDNNEKF